jgi:glycerol-3-phosphate dehydrogenase subunit C
VTLDPRDPKFFDGVEVENEMRRIFDVCHGCRMCFNYCPSFPSLFKAIDAHEKKGEGEVAALTKPELSEVVDLCYQCKLCYVKCPYTPPHRLAVDFPRVMLRAKASRARVEGVTRQDRFLGNPDGTARRSTGAFAPFVNWANQQKPLRIALEKTAGIHRDRQLPPFAKETFEIWFARTRGSPRSAAAPSPADTVAVFETCSVNYNYPNIGIAAVQVLERNGKKVIRPPQRCCGMPALDGGDIDAAVAMAHANAQALAPLASAGVPIVVLGPTCGYTIKKEWPGLVGSKEAQLVAEKVMDVGEYLGREHAAGRVDVRFTKPQGKLAYHIPCHLRAQNVGVPVRQLLAAIPGTQVETVERCSAFDGTWGMKKEYYSLSREYAKKLCNDLSEVKADRLVSDCPLAGINVTEELRRTPAHPVEVLRDAYGLTAGDAERSPST